MSFRLQVACGLCWMSSPLINSPCPIQTYNIEYYQILLLQYITNTFREDLLNKIIYIYTD